MESCVLLPKDFSLVLSLHPNPQNVMEMCVAVWSNVYFPPGTVFYPDEGEIRLDMLEVYSLLDKKHIRRKFGCYDIIIEVEGREVRHCNWVRFVKSSTNIAEVNIVGLSVQGDTIFQALKPIHPNDELVVFFDVPSRKTQDELRVTQTVSGKRDNSNVASESDLESPKSVSDKHSYQSSTIETESSPLIGRDDECKSGISATCSDVTTSDVTSGDVTSSDDINNNIVQVKSDTSIIDQTSHNNNMYSPPEVAVVKRNRERTWLPCEICGKKFDRPSLLKRHMRTHTGEKPHACDVCGKAFSTSSSLNTHRRIHSGEKPHQCKICGKCFTASSNLYYHRMTHNKDKPHKCTMCSKSFPTPGDLRSHMYVHSGSWPYKCDICNRGFSKQTNLKNHLLLHTGDRPHACALCGKKFALQCNLKTHMKTHDGDTKERDACRICNKFFLLSGGKIRDGVCHVCADDRTLALTDRNTENLDSSNADVRNKTSPRKHSDFSISKITGSDGDRFFKTSPLRQSKHFVTSTPTYAYQRCMFGMPASATSGSVFCGSPREALAPFHRFGKTSPEVIPPFAGTGYYQSPLAAYGSSNPAMHFSQTMWPGLIT